MSATRLWESLSVGGIEDAEALSDSNPFEVNTVVTLCRETVGTSAPVMAACVSSTWTDAAQTEIGRPRKIVPYRLPLRNIRRALR